jgi:hypothetical protein
MRQLEQTVREAGITPLITGAVREFHECLCEAEWSAGVTSHAASLIESLAKGEFQTAAPRTIPEFAASISEKESSYGK